MEAGCGTLPAGREIRSFVTLCVGREDLLFLRALGTAGAGRGQSLQGNADLSTIWAPLGPENSGVRASRHSPISDPRPGPSVLHNPQKRPQV